MLVPEFVSGRQLPDFVVPGHPVGKGLCGWVAQNRNANHQWRPCSRVLDKAVAAQKEKLEWRTSIVDLMKALNLDSSLAARKELAKELNYSGDTNNSATMNIWLHKQVIRKLAENGGKVPDDLKT